MKKDRDDDGYVPRPMVRSHVGLDGCVWAWTQGVLIRPEDWIEVVWDAPAGAR